jgi:hypothetical protein
LAQGTHWAVADKQAFCLQIESGDVFVFDFAFEANLARNLILSTFAIHVRCGIFRGLCSLSMLRWFYCCSFGKSAACAGQLCCEVFCSM